MSMKISSRILARKTQVIAGSIIAIVLVISLKSCGGAAVVEGEVEYTPEVSALRIIPGLQRSIRTTGEVEAEKSVNFLADYSSSVEEINVKIGDTVTEGQTLLVLKARSVTQDVTNANAVYVSTAQNLQQTRISLQQSVAEAQIALKTAQINLEKQQKENAARMRQAEEALKAASLNFSLTEASAQNAIDTAVRKTQTAVYNALTDADTLLEYSPVQQGLTYVKETHLGVRDPAQKLRTIDALNDTYKSLSSFVPQYSAAIVMLLDTERALTMLTTVLYNSVSSPQYSQETINANIDTVSGHLGTIRTIISELETAKKSLDSTMQKRGNTSQVIIDAQAVYDTTVAQLEASLRKSELDVERARSVLESAIASSKAGEISAITNVTTARGTLDQAKISNDKLSIVAPFSGVVTDIPVRVGREVQPGELVLSLEDASKLTVTTYVSTAEVKLLSTGDSVLFDDGSASQITSISPSADPQSKKYKVEIRVGSGALVPGEFISLVIMTQTGFKEDEKIFLPVTAVQVSAAETYVWVVEEKRAESKDKKDEAIFVAQKRSVTIGELSGKYIEIVRGLIVGDAVIIEGGRALTSDGQMVTVKQ